MNNTLEAQQALVACAIESAEHYERIASIVTVDDFADAELSTVFELVSIFRDRGVDTDPLIIASKLDQSERWAPFNHDDTTAYILGLSELSTSFKLAESYANIVHDDAISRRIHEFAGVASRIAGEDHQADEKVGMVSAELDKVTGAVSTGFLNYQQAAGEAFDEIQRVVEAGTGLSGQSTGFEALDAITAGLQDSDLIIHAARPSMGKTALALNIANHVARTQPVQFFSLEMSAASLSKRSFASVGGINMADLLRGKNLDVHHDRLMSAILQMKDMHMVIDESEGITVDQLRMRSRIAARKQKPRLIVVDYLTLLSGQGENRTAEVGYIAKSLKGLAKEMNCPVWCLAQLNRSVESRPNKRPLNSDLRDSGEIEQAADVILFNYLDEKYNPDSPRQGWLELIIGKQRNGETGTVMLEWEGHFQRFINPTKAIPSIEASSGNVKPFQRKQKGVSDDHIF